jgi:hypothetical protein
MEQYIGVDLHKQFFQACAVNPIGERVWEKRFPRSEDGLALFRARCLGQTALAVEACGPTWRSSTRCSRPARGSVSWNHFDGQPVNDNAPDKHLADFRRALLGVELHLAIESATLSALVSHSIERQRLGMWLMSAFAAGALLLAAVGVFGVVAFSVSQRTGEMAIRQALGATRGAVLWAIVRDAGLTALPGLLAGGMIAWWSGRLIAGYLYAVGPADPIVLAASVMSVATVTLVAIVVPGRRLAALDPARALRQ